MQALTPTTSVTTSATTADNSPVATSTRSLDGYCLDCHFWKDLSRAIGKDAVPGYPFLHCECIEQIFPLSWSDITPSNHTCWLKCEICDLKTSSRNAAEIGDHEAVALFEGRIKQLEYVGLVRTMTPAEVRTMHMVVDGEYLNK